MVTFAGMLTLGATAPTAAVAQEPSAMRTSYQVDRYSGNACGEVLFQYQYTARSDGFYNIKITEGIFAWRSDLLDKCGDWGHPYAPVLQWTGDTNTEGHFDWTVFEYGDDVELSDFAGAGYKNVRFRACNWNTTTWFIGTCGNS